MLLEDGKRMQVVYGGCYVLWRKYGSYLFRVAGVRDQIRAPPQARIETHRNVAVPLISGVRLPIGGSRTLTGDWDERVLYGDSLGALHCTGTSFEEVTIWNQST